MRAGKIRVAERMYEDFWKRMGEYLTPYMIEFDPLLRVYTITCTSGLFKDLEEGEAIPFYNPSFVTVNQVVLLRSVI